MRRKMNHMILMLCAVAVLIGCAPSGQALSASPKYVSMMEQLPGEARSPECATESQPERPAATPETQTSIVDRTGDIQSELVRQVNDERARQGLSPLRVDNELTRAACVRASEIVKKFSHTRPDGSKWSTVSASAYGENIAMGQRTVDKVMAAWMTSQGHRENILRPGYGSIGVCAVISNGVTYWVQLFGK